MLCCYILELRTINVACQALKERETPTYRVQYAHAYPARQSCVGNGRQHGAGRGGHFLETTLAPC